MGACYTWPLVEGIDRTACESASGSFYSGCHEQAIEIDPETPDWNETVSVYLQEAHLDQLVQEYRTQACSMNAPTLDAGLIAQPCPEGGPCAPSPICDIATN